MKSLFLAAAIAGTVAGGSAQFVINEIDPDTVGTDAAEFVEIFGPANTSVANLTLVFFNGSTPANPPSYLTLPLTGQTDANGYYLVGNSAVAGVQQTWANNTFQNGEDAVALYQRPSTDFPNGTPISSTGLLDAVAYGNSANATWSGFGIPITVYTDNASQSLSRVPNGTGSFVVQVPTPGSTNDIPAQPPAVTVSSANGIYFGRYNQANEADPEDRQITLSNSGGQDLTVNSFQIDPASDAQFSSIPVGVPTTLSPGQSISLSLFFANSDVSQTQLFEGAVTYSTNAPTSGSGSVPLTAEFVKVATPATGLGQLLINEMVYNNNAGTTNGGILDYNRDGFSDTTQDEFVEIFNPGATAIDVTGWVLTRENAGGQVQRALLGLNSVVQPGGYLAVFGGGNPTGFAAGTATTSSLQLSNDGGKVTFGDGTTVVDSVAYILTDNPDTDGYTNLPAITNGNSVGRRPDGSPTFREFVHNDPNIGDRPTPALSNTPASSVHDWQLF